MVRALLVVFTLLLFSIPASAQFLEEYPRFEIAMGYGNVGFPEFDVQTFEIRNRRHSGFAMHTGFNFTRWLGIENYTGVYGLGNNVTMLTNLIGGKVALRGGPAVPYGVAAFGIAYLTDERTFGSSNAGARLGGGVDVPLNEFMGLKFDVSRMSFNLDQWRSASNFSIGVVFNISY